MKIGVPREVKSREDRVAITPAGVNELVRDGHEVLVERDAGSGPAIPDADFAAAGARILDSADDVWSTGDHSVFYCVYCVANMPGAVPHTSTYALTNVTIPYAAAIANKGRRAALMDDHTPALGPNTYDARVTCAPVAAAHGLPVTGLDEVLH